MTNEQTVQLEGEKVKVRAVVPLRCVALPYVISSTLLVVQVACGDLTLYCGHSLPQAVANSRLLAAPCSLLLSLQLCEGEASYALTCVQCYLVITRAQCSPISIVYHLPSSQLAFNLEDTRQVTGKSSLFSQFLELNLATPLSLASDEAGHSRRYNKPNLADGKRWKTGLFCRNRARVFQRKKNWQSLRPQIVRPSSWVSQSCRPLLVALSQIELASRWPTSATGSNFCRPP